MKCWICGCDDATRSFEFSGSFYSAAYVSEGIERREDIKFNEIVSGFEYDYSARKFCQKCYDKHIKELEETRKKYALLKKKLMFERALRMFEKQAINIYEYKDIIDDMAGYIQENPDKFDSSHEMVAAIVLVDNGIKAKLQHKIEKYRVDFYIPEYKIVLEIDGELHKNNLFRDNQRDIRIREILGLDWETVRISTEYIEQNARALVEAMIAVKKEKQKIRRQHNGFLPDWYSARDKARYKRSFKVGDDKLFDM